MMRLIALACLALLGCVPDPKGPDLCVNVTCTASDVCHDVGTCDPQTGACSDPAKSDGSSCSDGNACTQGDSCLDGRCEAGRPRTCVANDSCHDVGTCDPQTGACSNPVKPDGATCTDGNACTMSDTCQNGICMSGNPRSCTAIDQCHEPGICDQSTGVCTRPERADGSACSDGNACTQSDTCQSGICTGASPRSCPASDQCHEAGSCDPMTGACTNRARADGSACSDGNACTLSDTCQSGLCTGANPRSCPAIDQCHLVGTCDVMSGACSTPARPDGTSCSDGNACTLSDSCQAGSCMGSNPRTCPASDSCHTAGTCDPQTGACGNPVKPDGSSCSDGNACTQTDICQAGSCQGANPRTCPAIDQCHLMGTCDVMTGVCSAPTQPNGTSCNDGRVETTNDVCTAGTCTGAISATSCRDLGTRHPPGAIASGSYLLRGSDGGAVPAWCEMGADDGGWTGIFIGRNGSPNVFDRFDLNNYAGTFVDPALRYLQRPPASLHDGFGELAVQCGSGFVSFPWTERSADYFVSGLQQGWTPLTPRVITGPVPSIPNTVWTGSGANLGFGVSRNQGISSNTFLSSTSSPSSDFCNGVADTTSIARVLVREAPPPTALNLPSAARATCRAIVLANESMGSGYYWLTGSSAPYLAYCDMTTADGGWTTLISTLNGSVNTFSHLDDSPFTEVCTDPGRRCVRRAPAVLSDSAAELSVSCGAAVVSFPLTELLRSYLQTGTRSGWLELEPVVRSGTVVNVPNTVFTGTTTERGVVFARNSLGGANTFASTSTSSTYDSCNNASDLASPIKVSFREVDAEPILNTTFTAGRDCAALLASGFTATGRYYVTDGAAQPYLVRCDMTTAGGGWTTFYAGRSGSVHTFDRFDVPVHQALCPDPSSRCVRRTPAVLADTQSEILASCGSTSVSFPTTRPAVLYFSLGTQQRWTQVTATVRSGTVLNVPNTLFTGAASNDFGFVLARNAASAGNTFVSSYTRTTDYDYCNNFADRTSFVRLAYRRLAQPVVRNTIGTAGLNCYELQQGGATQDGLYYVTEGQAAPYLAHCDMTTDNGGWTTVFAGRNGSTNVVDHYDAPVATGACPDPALRCQRRIPTVALGAENDVLVKCGTASVKFDAVNKVRNYLSLGTQGDWATVTPTVIAGPVINTPNSFFTGNGANYGFIFARNQSSGANTFGASYDTNTLFDSCNGVADQASMLTLGYRRLPAATVRNSEANARFSCRAIMDASESTGDGLYYVTEGSTAHLRYCDMTTGGGGWTAMYSGRNGSPHAFDWFDATGYAGTCSDPTTRCLGRAPSAITNAGSKLAVSCGSTMFEFPMTAGAANYFVSGLSQSWLPVTPTQLSGTTTNVPNSLYTGNGTTDFGFVFARNNASFANTFASAHSQNTAYDYCNNAADTTSPVRVYYREGP